MFIYQVILLLFLSSLIKIYATISLPLAPFQIKIQCKSGLSNDANGHLEKKEICPASSTSCAYIEIPSNKDKISIYECVDSSILSGEDDGEEVIKQNIFSRMCNHIPKCQTLNSSLLNPSFKKYISSTYNLPPSLLLNNKLTFCCSMNSGILEKIIKSKDKSQKFKTTSSLKCNNMTCGIGAIGCLSYQQFPTAKIVNAQDYIGDINDNSYDSNESYMEDDSYEDKNINNINNNNYIIEPFQIELNEEFDQNYRKRREVNNINKEYECVYPHLNDEVYRYCTMIYSNINNNDRCYNGKGFKVCCCYVRPNSNSCEPGKKELPPAITLPPKVVSFKKIIISDTITVPTTTISQLKLLKTSTLKPTTLPTNKTTKFKNNNINKSNYRRNFTRFYNKPTNKKCKFVTRQKMRRLQNDRDVILGGKILIYAPSYSGSHILTNGKIADTLVKEGHDVTLLIIDVDSTVKFNGTKLGKVVRMSNLSEVYDKMINDWLGNDDEQPDTASIWTRYLFEKASNEVCELIISRRHELDFLKEEKFDLGFVEMLEYCGHGILHYLGVKQTIWISTTPLHDTVAWNFGIPTTPSYIPSVEENFNGPVMNFYERLINTKQLFIQLSLQYVSSEMCNSLFRRHIDKNFPNLRTLASNSSIGFVMTDEILDVPRPILHKIIYIGGLGISNPKPLNSYWNNIMNMGKKGVILFSMGTCASFSTFTVEKKRSVLKAFNNFPDYHFILKINKNDNETSRLVKDYKNVHITTWMPQLDLLGHSNMKLFITHGGISSVIESHLNAIPMIIIPSFADQQRNAKFLEWRGTGKAILRSKLNFKNLKKTIEVVLNSGSYKNNVKRIQKLIKTKPGTPERKLIEWTNFVLENNGLVEFNSPATDLNIFVYHGIDVLLFIILFFIILIYLLIKFFKFIIVMKYVKPITNKKNMVKEKKA